MKAIQFETVVGEDQVIRPPAGVTLPQGAIQVTVQSAQPPSPSATDSLASTREWLLEIAAEAERSAPSLPSDMAEHHDHYAHGTPLTSVSKS